MLFNEQAQMHMASLERIASFIPSCCNSSNAAFEAESSGAVPSEGANFNTWRRGRFIWLQQYETRQGQVSASNGNVRNDLRGINSSHPKETNVLKSF